MKRNLIFLLAILIAVYLTGCLGKGKQKQAEKEPQEETSVPDTGYTGIKQYYSGNFLSYEVEFKNGVRHGLMKTYYPSGKLRQTFWYQNGMREDTAIWYYEDGQIFRKTPYKRDTMHGVQIQYYRTGKIRAKLEFENGKRKPYLEEFTSDGKKITDYPDVVIKTEDNYSKNGTYKILLSLSKKDVKARFYRGGYVNGLFDPTKLTKINDTDYTGVLVLKKSGVQGNNYVEIIAEISTPLRNTLLVNKKIELPYNDLR